MVGLLLIGLAIAAWFLLRDPGKQGAADNLATTPAPVIADTSTKTTHDADKSPTNTDRKQRAMQKTCNELGLPPFKD